MRFRRLLYASALVVVLTVPACFGDRVVAPDQLLPALLAIDRPTVRFLRFRLGRRIVADTVRISNNGEGPLGIVSQVGGVDYITQRRAGWLDAKIEITGENTALLILTPTYADEVQDASDIAEVVLQAANSEELRRVTIIVRTLRGASFEFSVSPLAFAAVPGDPSAVQRLTVRNGGNGTLTIDPPSIQYKTAATGWLTVTRDEGQGSDAAPVFTVQADPSALPPRTSIAELVFASPPGEETQAEPATLEVQIRLGEPALALSTPALAFTAILGEGNPPGQTILVSNSGDGAFEALGAIVAGSVTYGPNATGWLDVGQPTQSSIVVDALVNGLVARTNPYTASFPVTSDNGGPPQIVQVALSLEGPVLTVSSRAVAFGLVAGAAGPPGPRVVQVSNSGSGTFSSLGGVSIGSFSPLVPWLTASLSGADITLTPTAASTTLAVGDHVTTLPVTSVFGGDQLLTVTLSVSPTVASADLTLSASAVSFVAPIGGAAPAPKTITLSNGGGGTIGSLGALGVGVVTYPVGTPGWLDAPSAPTLVGTTLTIGPATAGLPVGTHTATVPVTSDNGGNETLTVTVDVLAATLTASATALSFTGVIGGVAPPLQTITLSNTGAGPFANLGAINVGTVVYGAGAAGWLTAPANGAAVPGTTVDFTVSLAGLAAGTYSATAPVVSANGGTATITVTLSVVSASTPPDLAASPSTVRFDAVTGGANPGNRAVLLSNVGGGTLGALGVNPIVYGPGAAGWLTAPLGGSTITLSATTGALAAGTYTATVTATSANGGNETIAVTFVVGAPILTLSTTSASFNAVQGGAVSPAVVNVTISNTGVGDFSSLGTVSLGATVYPGAAGWLTATLGGGSNTASLVASAAGLAVGTHTATVPVTSTSGGNSAVAVSFTVSPTAVAASLVLSPSDVSFADVLGGAGPPSQGVEVSNGGGGGFAALGVVAVTAPAYTGGPGTGWLSATLGGSTVTLTATTGALLAATYTATVTVTSVNGGNQDVDITFVVGSPTLTLSTTSASFNAVLGGAVSPDVSVTVSNTGAGNFASLGTVTLGAVTYVTGTAGWLDPPDDPALAGATITIGPSIAGLPVGTHTATVPVTSTQGGNQTVSVSLTVSAAPTAAVMVLSATAVAFADVVAGAGPPSQTVVVTNSGGGGFASLGTVAVGAPVYPPGPGPTGWLTAGIAGSTITLTATTGVIVAGTYTATVDVTSTVVATQTINVTFNVVGAGAADLELGTNPVTLTSTVGGASPAARVVAVNNLGTGALGALATSAITYGAGTPGWLAVGTTASTVTLTATTGGLPANTHTASLTVTSANDAVGEVLNVSFTVGQPTLTLSTGSVSFNATAGGASPAGQAVTITNTGAGAFADLGAVSTGVITFVPAGTTWLTAAGAATGTLTLTAATGALAAGTYTANVPVLSANGGADAVSVTFTVSPNTAPDLAVSASAVSFTAILGAGAPATKTISVSNAGGGTFSSLGNINVGTVTYPGAAGWLTAPASGAPVPGSTIDFTVSLAGLVAGTHTATVPVTSVNGGNETVTVTLNVLAPVLTASATGLSFTGPVGGAAPALQTVNLSNTGAGTFANLGAINVGTVTYSAGAAGWLTAPLNGAAVAGTSIDFTVSLAGVAAGTYTATVPVASANGGNPTITVTLSVVAQNASPDLELSASAVSFVGILGAGAPPSKTISISNGGGGTTATLGTLGLGAAAYIAGTAGWLDPPSDPTLLGAVITLAPSVAGLPAGTHTATVLVTSTAGGSETITVSIDVLAPVLTASATGLSFTGLVGGAAPATQTITLSNTGAGTFANLGAITVGTVTYPGAAGWLTTPANGAPVPGTTILFTVSLAGLATGTHSATVPVASVNGGNQTITVTLSVVAANTPPDLVVSPATVRFDAVTGGGNPADRTVLLSNVGGGTLGALGVNPIVYGPGAAGWLTAALAGSTITLSATTGALATATYTATVTATSANGGNEAIAVTFVVGAPKITVSPRTVSFSDEVGGTGQLRANVTLANTGGGTLASLGTIGVGPVAFGMGGTNWLTATQVGSTVTLIAQATGLAARSTAYQAVVPVTSQFGGSDQITVSFTVAPGATAPRLTLSVESLTFSATPGGADPAAQTVLAVNSGGGNLGAVTIVDPITYTSAVEDWLSGDVDGSSVNLHAHIGGFTSGGLHTATVLISSENGGSLPVDVNLNVAQPDLSLSTRIVTFSDTVGSAAPLESRVFISNTGGGNRDALGILTLGTVTYPTGESGWLTTIPAQGGAIAADLELRGEATTLPPGDWVALVPVESQWGGSETVEVTFSARQPDRSFDLPTIEIVQNGVPIDSVVVAVTGGSATEVSVRVGITNAASTAISLSGLRVDAPVYRSLDDPALPVPTDWITAAFLDRTSAPAELFVAIDPSGLTSGRRLAAILVIRTEAAGLEGVVDKPFRVIVVVQ